MLFLNEPIHNTQTVLSEFVGMIKIGVLSACMEANPFDNPVSKNSKVMYSKSYKERWQFLSCSLAIVQIDRREVADFGSEYYSSRSFCSAICYEKFERKYLSGIAIQERPDE